MAIGRINIPSVLIPGGVMQAGPNLLTLEQIGTHSARYQRGEISLEELTEYNDGGTNLPNIYIVLGKRIVDLSGMQSGEQIVSLGSVELAGCGADEPLIVAATKRVDA